MMRLAAGPDVHGDSVAHASIELPLVTPTVPPARPGVEPPAAHEDAGSADVLSLPAVMSKAQTSPVRISGRPVAYDALTSCIVHRILPVSQPPLVMRVYPFTLRGVTHEPLKRMW